MNTKVIDFDTGETNGQDWDSTQQQLYFGPTEKFTHNNCTLNSAVSQRDVDIIQYSAIECAVYKPVLLTTTRATRVSDRRPEGPTPPRVLPAPWQWNIPDKRFRLASFARTSAERWPCAHG